MKNEVKRFRLELHDAGYCSNATTYLIKEVRTIEVHAKFSSQEARDEHHHPRANLSLNLTY